MAAVAKFPGTIVVVEGAPTGESAIFHVISAHCGASRDVDEEKDEAPE